MIWSSSDAPAPAVSWDELDTTGPAGAAAEAARQEAAVEAAYRRGLVEGREAAHEAARRELASAVTSMRQALDEVVASREAWAERLENNLVALAAAIARHIVDRELREDPETFAALAAQAVTSFPTDEPLRIRLHPDDLDAITAIGAPDALGADRNIRWVPDEEMRAGGCIVEGPDRIVDGRIDEALRRIYQELAR